MLAQTSHEGHPRSFRQQISRACQLITLLAVVGCLCGAPIATQNTLWAQPPMPPGPPVEDDNDPEFVDFTAVPLSGGDNWLISGQVVGCNDPSDIAVTIGGTVSASAFTDFYGYFEVLVTYSGVRDTITADGDYAGNAIPTAESAIGT